MAIIGEFWGLTTDPDGNPVLPPAAKSNLSTDLANPVTTVGKAVADTYATKTEAKAKDADVAALVNDGSSTTVTALAARYAPGNGARPVGRGELEVSARDFGAIGDGVANDTAALNAFLDYITLNKKAGFMPGTNYRITAPLIIPSRAGWSLRGNGNRGTLITQDTDNVPIIQLGDADSFALNHFRIQGLWLTYKNMQPATNTEANCIRHFDMAWEGVFDDIGFKRGHYGMAMRSGIGAPWGVTFDNLHFGNELTGGAMNWSGSVNRVPNNRFGRLYVEIGPMSKTIFDIRGYNFVIDTIEFIPVHDVTTDCPKLFAFGTGTRVEIGTFKVENVPLTVGKQLVDVVGDSYVNIGHITWSGGLATANLTTGTTYFFALGASTSPDAVVRVGSMDVHLGADTTSPMYLYRSNNADTSLHIGRLRTGNGWKPTNLPSNPGAALTFSVGEWVNGKNTTRGDANTTIALRDPTVNRFTTAFTAARTITLPSDGYFLHNGLYYDLVFDGAINGANTATIKAGNTTYRVQSTDKAVLRYTWTGTSGANGWALTSYQTLP